MKSEQEVKDEQKGERAKMPSYNILRGFGFSKTAVICYQDIFEHGGASMQQLAERLGRPRVSLYRSLRQLEAKGFVASVRTERQPTHFYAEPLEMALRRYADYQRQAAGKLIEQQAAVLARRSRRSNKSYCV